MIKTIATAQKTLADMNDIWVVDEEPASAPDGTIIFLPRENVMKQYDASANAWRIISDYDTMEEYFDNLNNEVEGIIGDTTNNPEYQALIKNRDNAQTLLDLIANSPYLLDLLTAALKIVTTSGGGTTLKSLTSASDCSVFIGQDEVRMIKSTTPFATFSALRAVLPQSVQVGDANGSKVRVGNFIGEHQASGNFTIRKV